MKNNEIKQLTDREHVLLRSGTYLGSINLTEINTFMLNKNFTKCEWKSVKYIPALLKIIYEILDNAIDESLRTNFKYANKIDITVDDKREKITVRDNGRGIPLSMTKDAEGNDISQLELALTSLRAGSNFNDAEGRTSLGQNGVGSSCTNIFSKYFHAVSIDGKQKGDLLCENNMETKTCVIKDYKAKSSEIGTFIEFIPDYKRFKQKNLSEVHIDLLYQRIMFLSYMYPEIKFTYNGSQVKFKNAKTLVSIFSDKCVCIQDNSKVCHYMIGVIPNENDDFTHKSYINGADCVNGGNHLDYIHSELVGRIKEKLAKKYPSIRPGDIKNRLSYIVCFREFVNPMFNSQTKENFSSDTNEIKEFLKAVDWDEFSAKVCKCDEIIDPIVESFKIKEELKNRQTLNKLGNTGRKKVRCEKYLPAIKENKYISITERRQPEQLVWLMD